MNDPTTGYAAAVSLMGLADTDADAQRDETLTQVTLGRRVAESLRSDILFGRLQPGTRLAQHQICQRFGISRMPVRDALRQLTYEGYLIRDAGRHCIVARMSRQDIVDTFTAEGMLHGFAARRVAEAASAEELRELEERHIRMSARVDKVHEFAALNWDFHRRINLMANSRRVVAALKALATTMPRDFVSEFPEWVPAADAQHAAIVEAMLRRDGALTESLMRDHIGSAGYKIADYLERKGVALD